ncbi:MAG: DUF4113 domain-containing protein [Micrococcaceae bacterium]
MKLIGLVDVNNFFVSCERIFNPKLLNKPTVVLSNNDGCVIARSEEAKALGVKMAIPLHKVPNVVKNQLNCCSSNFMLYDDISNRVVAELKSLTPEITPYSIDEAFIIKKVDNIEQAKDFGQKVVNNIYQHLSLPVCVGFAPTKTLAKLSNHIAKKNPQLQGVYVWGTNPDFESQLLAQTSVSEIWGVGRKIVKQLNLLGIETIADLQAADPNFIRKKFSVILMRTALELNGIPCIEDIKHKHQQSLIYSRAFATEVYTKTEMQKVIVEYTQKAIMKLRRHGLLAGATRIFASTSYYGSKDNYVSFAKDTELKPASADIVTITKIHKELLDKAFEKPAPYVRAGITFYNLIPKGYQEAFEIFDDKALHKLQDVYEDINYTHGYNTLIWGATNLSSVTKKWLSKGNNRSPDYVSDWNEIPQARIKL